MSNWRNKTYISVFKKGAWKLEKRDTVLESFTRHRFADIEDMYNELDENDPKDKIIIKKLDNFFNNYNENEKVQDGIKTDIELVLYNKRKMVENIRKMNDEIVNDDKINL